MTTRTSITYYFQLRFTTSSPWNISRPTKVEENNIYIKWKVLSNGAVYWKCNQSRTANICKAKIHVLNDQVIRRVNEHTHNRIVHQPTIGYTDLSTDSFKKCLEFGWQGDIVYRI